MVCFKKGDIFDSGADAIINAVDRHGVKNPSIAKRIWEKYPESYDNYQKELKIRSEKDMLITPGYLCKTKDVEQYGGVRYIYNMFTLLHSQDKYGRSIDGYHTLKALRLLNCLGNNIRKVAIPYKFDCDIEYPRWREMMHNIGISFPDTSEIICEIWEKE